MAYDPGVQEILRAVEQHGPDTQAYKALGNIYVERQFDLLLFNYSQRCLYERRWNDVEQSSRGLVINWQTGAVMALPWRKFYNLGERPETMLDSLPAEPFEATEKLDGSLGIVLWYGMRWRVVTRGRFASKQAAWAEAWLHQNVKFNWLPTEYTYLTEIIYPDNRVVINYEDKAGLVLLGARLTASGAELAYPYLLGLGESVGLEVVPRVAVTEAAAFVQMAEELAGVEGWVLRFRNGLRVKIKTREYLRLHRLISDLTPARVRDVCAGGDLEPFLVGLPEEFADEARGMGRVITDYVAAELERLYQVFGEVRQAVGLEAPRRDFAIYVTQNHPADAPYLFAYLSEKPVEPMIYKSIDSARLAQLFPGVPILVEE